jgi:DNA-binding XRE family transcriptional regulator
MPKPNHIIAARGHLRWSQETLADACGVSPRTITLIENEKQNPSQDTLLAIELAFDRAGVVFRDNGVLLEDRHMTVLEGASRLARLLDDVRFVLHGGGELLIDGAVDRKTPPPIIAKVRELRASGIRMRHLVCDQDRFLLGPVDEYRWVPANCFVNQVIFTYGDTVALALETEPKILIQRDPHLARYTRERFNLLWDILDQPDTSEADDRY